jgi:hypothetical protein
MNWSEFENWLSDADILVVAVTVSGAMYLAAALGAAVRARSDRLRPQTTGGEGEGLVVSAALGLLALLIGFTFSLAVERLAARRLLVLEEANAIGATYLRAQLLDEPHRSNMRAQWSNPKESMTITNWSEWAAEQIVRWLRLTQE